MTAGVPDIEADTVNFTRRSRVPGLDAVRATVGFQRGMLFGGVALMTFFVVLAVFAPWLAPYGFNQASADGVQFKVLQPPNAQHWFGTTHGREDVLSQVIYGAQ